MSLHGRPYIPGPLAKTFDPSNISWSIAGQAAMLDWDSFEATAPGGFGQFKAKAMPNRGVRHKMKQGDRVVGRKPNGDIVYQGKLEAPPKYVDEVAYFSAMGPRSVVDGFNDRLPYQIRDASQWHELHSDPARFANNSAKLQIAQKGNSIGVVADQNSNYHSGDNQGYYLWVQDWDISNVRYTLRRTNSFADFDLRVRRSDDSFSAPTTVTSYPMTTADGTTKNDAISASASVVIIDWNCNVAGPTAPAANNRFWVDAVRVGVITDQDVFTSGEVAQDVGNRCGYETDCVGSANMMPLDWNSPATDLLDYCGDIEDQVWLVMDSKKKGTFGKLIFRPWGNTTWHTSLGDWAEDQSLEVQTLYNRVTTTYQNPPGVQQSVRSAPEDFNLKDPLPGQAIDYPSILQLEDPQPDSSLALAVNAKALSKLTKVRLKGTLLVRSTREGVPFDIEAGDVIKVGGFQPDVPPQRIASVNYQKDGTVQLSLGIDYNLAALVDQRITKHLKRRNRRR